MLSLASILNPEEPSRASSSQSPPRSISSSHFSSRPVVEGSSPAAAAARPSSNNANTTLATVEHPSRGYPRSRPRGGANFEPFENLDSDSLMEVRRFDVFPFGRIMDTARRIPYNSSKKDFYQKTGRESFDVIHYEFKLPKMNDKTVYTVMWDYSVGLVRMTPFFKCLEYSKTTPAKMLNLNPGLKDITYSITGGSIKAQGYWMPYDCAKAVCATFCYKIAGALIPLFGPDFPSLCVPDGAPGFKHMVIDQAIVAQAKRETARICLFPRPCGGPLPSPTPSGTISPRPSQRSIQRAVDAYEYRRDDYDRQNRMLLSPYGPESDFDYRSPPPADLYGRSMFGVIPPMRSLRGPPPTSATRAPLQPPRAWTAVNHHQLHRDHHTHHPTSRPNSFADDDSPNNMLESGSSRWLTAVPRSQTPFAYGRRAPPPPPPPRSSNRLSDFATIPSALPTPVLPPIRGYHDRYGSVHHSISVSTSNKRSLDQMDDGINTTARTGNTSTCAKRSFDHQTEDDKANINTSANISVNNSKRSFDHKTDTDTASSHSKYDEDDGGTTHHMKQSAPPTPTPPSLSHPSPPTCSNSSPCSSSSSLSSPSSSFSASPSSAPAQIKRPANEADAAMMLIQLKVGPKQENDEHEEMPDVKESSQQKIVSTPPRLHVKTRTPLPGSRDRVGDRDRERAVKRLRRTLV
ncbi:hypothetical protein QBC43DRAFT_110818 [Cladorrhinum sp. PSN259]|nr:hypothetical protein QBC43DRAFT_110818 [Cladorrhinum sp. PSN259]